MTKLKSLLPVVLLISILASGMAGQVSSTGGSVGLIVLSESYSKKDFIHIYNGDGTLWHRFSFYYDDRDGKFDYANDDFRPFAFHPDYFLLALKCVGKEAGRYEVIVNEEAGLKKYVKADDPSLRFETWRSHILRVSAVGFDRKGNPVLDAPQGRVKRGSSLNAPFRPVEVRGEWLRIKWEPYGGARDDSGWIRWKRGKRLIIEFFYFS